MNKVITINLNGIAYQLEESGYEALREYLDNAARRLEGNPDKEEIIADIERAIADKFRAVLGAYKTVVVTKEVESVIAEMGPVQDVFADEPASGAMGARAAEGQGGTKDARAAGAESTPRTSARRLYKIKEGAMISGVCNGLAAYFDIDVTIVRIIFTLLAVTWGTGVLLYIFMMIIVPEASTPAEKAEAQGGPSTAEEFIRRAKAGYYEGMKTFHDKQAHREWKRKFKQEMRGWKRGFQREMQESTHQWQQHWAQHPRFPFGAVFVAPFLSLLLLLCLGVWLYALYSLVTAGSVFGVPLPAGIPLWIGIIFLIVVYHFFAWPLKAMRYTCYYQGSGPCPPRSLTGPFDGLVWLGFIVLIIWLADHYVPQVHEALQNLPPVIHRTLDSVQEWWAKR